MAKDGKKYFLIVDGNALLHRAWHAIPPLTTKDGRLVHGAYGFTTIMLGAIRQFHPTHVAVTFDLAGKTFRHEEYKEYKATREKKPDELYEQIPVIERVLDAMGIPVFTAKGFEADDVIGTISRIANETDGALTSVVVTGDLDTLQLVDDRTLVFTMRRGMSDTVTYDAKAVKERYGLRPDQMIDYKALRGDPSDNIPGVKGIGEKTASELLADFNDLDALYAAIESDGKKAAKLKPSVREKLVTHKADALQARGLCTIRRDVPVPFDLQRCAFAFPPRSQVAAVFEDLQFLRLLSQFPEDAPTVTQQSLFAASPAPAREDAAHADKVRGRKALDAIRALTKSGSIAFRSMTKTDDPVSPDLVVLGITDGTRTFLFDAETVATVRPALGALLSDPSVRKTCHDLKREIEAAASAGLAISGATFDIMIASYLLHSGERRHALGSVLSLYRNLPPEPKTMTDAEREERLAAELRAMLEVGAELEEEMRKQKLETVNETIELPLSAVLARMERGGIAIDAPYFSKLSRELGKKIDALSARITKIAGEAFNINSPGQLKAVLFDKLQIPTAGIKKTEKGGALSTAAAELEKLRGAHPIIDPILEYREFSKLKSTYVDAIPALVNSETGRVHARFNQTVTATGRLSSSDPNMQNIPTPETDYGKRVRNGFVAGKGSVLLAADYSQIELRIAAHIAKEKHMIEAFRRGEDIHRHTAIEMWGEQEADSRRRVAKAINFGILYGMGAQSLAANAGISFTEAREYIDRYFAIHTGITDYVEGVKERLKNEGYVETLFGRRRWFRNYALMNRREQAEAERQAINMPIQGTQADIIKLAMVRIDAMLGEEFDPKDVRMVLQVHDELVFEVKKGLVREIATRIRPLMEKVCDLSVPVAVDISFGERWGEMEDLEEGS